ncbi:integrase catalytic domain-containing protein [Trichonephila clavipes]|nr:integrase catalytic domain-containing protein [Trichonephila clavipes]
MTHRNQLFFPQASIETVFRKSSMEARSRRKLTTQRDKYHEWPHIKDLTLADPTFYIENEIDILLGADVFITLISGTPIMGPKGTPSAMPTKLDHSLKQFWELESVPKDIPSKDEDELCESIFVNSHIRNADGRYILKLPFRDDSSLVDSKEGALNDSILLKENFTLIIN